MILNLGSKNTDCDEISGEEIGKQCRIPHEVTFFFLSWPVDQGGAFQTDNYHIFWEPHGVALYHIQTNYVQSYSKI